MYSKQLSPVIEKIIIDSTETEEVKPELIDGYKQLSEKCDYIISKIKNRKSKKEK